jgi:hypothetical protein
VIEPERRSSLVRLAAMQPYFFPYLGYFALIKNSDRFILCDTVQFKRHGWIARNRILKPQEGWQYIVVPLAKHSHKAAINEVGIAGSEPWRERLLKQMTVYKRTAPYYGDVMDFLQAALQCGVELISELNAHLLSETCRYLGIPFVREVFSEMKVPIEQAGAPDEWGILISRALNADTYVNPPGGIEFYDPGKYSRADIRLEFLKVTLRPYDQGRRSFEEGLSILDVMMFNKPARILEMLDDYEILQGPPAGS